MNSCRSDILAQLGTWKHCLKLISAQALQTYKIEAISLPKGWGAGPQLHTCSACHHHTRSPVPVTSLASQLRLSKPFGAHCKASNKQFSTVAPAGKNQLAMAFQHSGVFKQEVVTQEISNGVSTPVKKARRRQVITNAGQVTQSPDTLVTSSDFADSLADRIKSGSGRRRTKTTKAKTDVGAAAVNALADVIDAMTMPSQGATKRYLDSRDADLNVPEHSLRASSEQTQHVLQPTKRQAVPSGDAPDGVKTPELQPRQHVKKRRSKSAKPGVIQIGSELAQGPDVSEDKLLEEAKVRRDYVSPGSSVLLLTWEHHVVLGHVLLIREMPKLNPM